MIKKISSLLFCALFISGCTEMRPGQTMGTVVGGALGGLAGAQFGKGTGKLAMTATGAILGGLLGGSLMGRLDQRDQQQAIGATETALNTGRPTQWQNDQTGHYGTVVPQPSYQKNHRIYRNFKQLVYIDGRPTEVNGTAYLGEDGLWHVVP